MCDFTKIKYVTNTFEGNIIPLKLSLPKFYNMYIKYKYSLMKFPFQYE